MSAQAAAYRQRLFRTGASDTLPITLRHQRIYILPTRLGLAMASVVLLMLVASVNYRLSLGYALSFILTGLFASCLLNAYRNLSGIELRENTAEDCFAPGPLAFRVEVGCQDTRKRYSVEIGTAHTAALTDIEPGSSGVATLYAEQVERGQHKLGRLTIASSFPLGLWRSWAYVHTPVDSYVYPTPETPAAPFPPVAGTSEKATQANGLRSRAAHSGDFDSLRNWQPTDSPGSVAWKAVAKGKGWYSKDFASATQDEALLLRWDELPASMPLEQRLSRLCAWIVQARAQSRACRVVMPGIESINLQGGQMLRLMRYLATIDRDADDRT